MKRKRPEEYSTDSAYRRNIGELTASVEGTKFLLERGDLESDHLKRPRERPTFG